MRPEQASAVDKAEGYHESIWAEDSRGATVPWNAKMRFGKTFASHQLAKRLGAKRILVVTFEARSGGRLADRPESHADFDGWQYLLGYRGNPDEADKTRPLVHFWFVPGPARARSEDRPHQRRRTSGSTPPTGTSSFR